MCDEKPDWLTPKAQERLREIEYGYHIRVFGEEMARVNFLPLEQRKAYVYDIVDFARSKGVPFEKESLGVTR